jgi:hypothetical protein
VLAPACTHLHIITMHVPSPDVVLAVLCSTVPPWGAAAVATELLPPSSIEQSMGCRSVVSASSGSDMMWVRRASG